WLGMARIQWYHDASRGRHRHVDFEVLVAVQRQNGHAITWLNTELGQGTGQAAAARPGFGVGQTYAAIDHGDMVGKQLLGSGERINKGVHGASSSLGVSCKVVWGRSDIMTAVLLADYPCSKVPSYGRQTPRFGESKD